MQDGMLIIDVGDGYTDCLKLVALGAHLVEELPNFTVLGALHANEHLVEVGLGMFTLGQEVLLDIVPVFFGHLERHYIQGDLLGDALIQEIVRDLVLASPSLNRLRLLVSRIAWVLQDRASGGAIEITPMAGGDHGFQEVKCEHSPLCAFNIKVRDIGAELFDVERSGRCRCR